MITKLPPAGFKILQISLQIMHHFLSRLCWPLLKVHFAGHAHVKLVLDVGMWVTDWECGSLVRNYPRAEGCGQDKIASASIQTYDMMVACSNSKELCPNLFRRRKGFTTKTKKVEKK